MPKHDAGEPTRLLGRGLAAESLKLMMPPLLSSHGTWFRTAALLTQRPGASGKFLLSYVGSVTLPQDSTQGRGSWVARCLPCRAVKAAMAASQGWELVWWVSLPCAPRMPLTLSWDLETLPLFSTSRAVKAYQMDLSSSLRRAMAEAPGPAQGRL